MIPKPRKVGEKVTLLCPFCDGEKVNELGEPCKECGGCGEVEGTVSK